MQSFYFKGLSSKRGRNRERVWTFKFLKLYRPDLCKDIFLHSTLSILSGKGILSPLEKDKKKKISFPWQKSFGFPSKITEKTSHTHCKLNLSLRWKWVLMKGRRKAAKREQQNKYSPHVVSYVAYIFQSWRRAAAFRMEIWLWKHSIPFPFPLLN